MKLLLRLLIYVIAILLLSACTQTWKFQKDGYNTKQKALDNEIAVIEQMEGRWSPRIKIFKHIDLDIYKKQGGRGSESMDLMSPGRLHEHDWATPTRVETPPGKIRLGVILNKAGFKSYSYVKFNAAPNHKYLLTWICIPYSFIAVVDEKTSRIVAIDMGCKNCDWLIGTEISQNTECVYDRAFSFSPLIPHPHWGKFNWDKVKWEYNPPFDEEKLRWRSNSPYDEENLRTVYSL